MISNQDNIAIQRLTKEQPQQPVEEQIKVGDIQIVPIAVKYVVVKEIVNGEPVYVSTEDQAIAEILSIAFKGE